MFDFKAQLKILPDKPGVYLMKNTLGEIIYVGKAKNLKRRVSSYFNKKHDIAKLNVLVKNISYLRFIVVDTPEDALLLENNLIKEYMPRYNAMMKDGKTYPSICITKEEFPRIFKTRNIDKKMGEYYGPFSSVWTINAILDIIHQLYKIRTCSLPLTENKIAEGKFKLCLEYHIKNCKGPCEELQSKEDYNQDIDEIRQIIKGNANEISKMLFEKMKKLIFACFLITVNALMCKKRQFVQIFFCFAVRIKSLRICQIIGKFNVVRRQNIWMYIQFIF